MFSETSNTANLAPEEDQGLAGQSRPLVPPMEHLQDSHNEAQKLVSIGHKVIGPLKTKITNRARIAKASNSAVIALTKRIATNQGPGDESQAKTIVVKAQQDLYHLDALPELIRRTMELPSVAQRADLSQLQEAVTEHYRDREAGTTSQLLSANISDIRATLLEYEIDIPEYVPTTDDVRKAYQAAHEEQEYMVVEVPHDRLPTAPPSASPISFQGSGVSSMLYDDAHLDTMTAIHNSKAQVLIDELVREKAEAAERDRSQQQQILQLTEQLAQLSEQNVQRNSLFTELITPAHAGQQSMVDAGTAPKPAVETLILTSNSTRPPAVNTTASPLVQPTMSAPVNHAATELSSKQPQLSSTQYLDIMNAINNIQAQINNNQRSYAGIESNIGHRENTRDSKPDIRIPSRKQHRPPSRQSKTAYVEDSDLESSLYSDGEHARIVYSGSGDNYGHRRHSRHNSETARDQKQRISEPKLATVLSLLPKFDGSGDWEEFRDAFTADVLSRGDIRPNQMHKILSDHVIGKARDCVATSKDHAAAIEATFSSLERAFGKTHSKEKLLKKLNKLSFHQTDTEQMRQDMAKIDNLTRLLLEKGMCNTDDRMTKVVASKLPQALRKRVLDDWKDNETTIKEVIDTASKHISSLELEQEIIDLGTANSINEIPRSASINYTNSRPSGEKNKPSKPVYDASNAKTKFFDHVTKTSLPGYYAPGRGINLKLFPVTFPFDAAEPLTCAACSNTGHSSVRCKDTSSEFRRNVERKKLCPLCLSANHAIENCKSNKLCIYCGGMHHTGGCPTKEFYRDLTNYPRDAKPRQTFFRERSNKNKAQ
ncbi:hypothetical protein B9Z55_021852 [Caenorhabditis nigoni]|uniref:Uncharacterized protein n=1 Tax=Caenorhabditis nigoni TaxID=1611254 RepID=A0A2G5TTU0_9PELO|nr:hypothetical protein B9Z55_021852 [Caenorhabditis nigoni]